MKQLFFQMSSVGLMLACLQTTPLYSADEGAAPVPTRANAADPNSEVYRASDVMNMPVKDQEGNEVGKIKDFVINGETREVLYAVVAMNDGKEQDALYVMPWTAFQPNYAQQGAALQYTVLTIPRNVWLQAPFYSAAQWRTVPFNQWGPRVNNYYSQHITVRNNSRGTSVTTNKPSLSDEKNRDTSSNRNNPRREDASKGNDRSSKDEKPNSREREEKPATSPQPNKNVEPRQSDKPAPKTQDTPAVKGEKPQENDSKLPAPKNPDPAGPNNQTKPAPKAPAPNPK